MLHAPVGNPSCWIWNIFARDFIEPAAFEHQTAFEMLLLNVFSMYSQAHLMYFRLFVVFFLVIWKVKDPIGKNARDFYLKSPPKSLSYAMQKADNEFLSHSQYV